VNDQKPMFDKLDYYTTVSEAVTAGSEVLNLAAVDHDTGINSKIHYTLRSLDNSTNDHTMFTIAVS